MPACICFQSKSTMAISSTPADPDLIEMIVEDETITFSRSLLMQCSPFFQNTFKDGRARKKRVVVSGVSGQTFKDLLEYMKTGKLELSCNNVAEIFHAACKLQMPDIICRCIEMETHTSPIGRQIILYKTAKRMSIPEEKNSAFHHLISNFSLVSESKEFLELDAKDVCELLSADVLGCRGEMDVFSAACHWINHKVHPRMAYASRLMHCVRFALMNLIELNQCLETKTPPGLSNIRSVRIMILSAVCFWVAKAAGKEAEVSHLARKSRQYKVLSKKSSLKNTDHQGTLFLIGGAERDLTDRAPSNCPILSYDVKTNSWNPRKTLPVHRYGHKAVYLDGHIYIVGGFENFSPVNLEKTSSRCCFWYEVSRGQWGIMAPLNSTRAYHGLAVLGNSVYAVGGVDSNNRLLGCVERYDKTMDEWTKLSSELYSPRMAMGSCGHRGQLWVAGGIVQIGRRTCSTAYVEVYSPEAERWSFAVNFLPSPRSCLTLVECDGILYAVGGLLSHRAGKQRSFTTVEDMLVLVDDRNAWVDKTPMPMARHSVVTTTHDGLVFVLGGKQAEKPECRFDSILAFDTRQDQWFCLGNVPKNLSDYHCVLVPPRRPYENLRQLLTSRGDHTLAYKITDKLSNVAADVKSYSQGDVALKKNLS
ncbi:kelch-like protein 17 [Ixodes scapularis]|uniref:kelch-like protein 17 n=1 Tax=Ixodes scapularis TaxID=6945 RepID=UPI001A9D9D2D|nr:kelch-like protein 17 [Ixodes scapularis]